MSPTEIANSAILDRSEPHTSPPNTYDIRLSIISKLQSRPEMATMRDEMLETKKAIYTNLQRNPREDEVALLNHCIVC